ncbi:MAG: preprotein translocase subunit SecA, partial [Chitinophagales bacterium]
RHDEVITAGGLHIIGTERHESRRIDNQLRGRSGRQGDPGSTRFYLSMEDTLMRIFASEKVAGLMHKLGMEDGEAIEHPWVSKAIENAQRKVEAHNFDIRKQLLQYDDVANDQRKVVYQQRNDLLHAENIDEAIQLMRLDVIEGVFRTHIAQNSIDEQWKMADLELALKNEFGLELPIQNWFDEDEHITDTIILDRIIEHMELGYSDKVNALGEGVFTRYEKELVLHLTDRQWKEHLAAMDHLRQGIGLRGYAQKNPVQEYKRESFEMFTDMLDNIKYEAVQYLTQVQIKSESEVEALEKRNTEDENIKMEHASAKSPLSSKDESIAEEHQPYIRKEKKIGRNEPCWCDSGKKFKQCHGKLT